jgi:hypothetical protein
MKHVFPINKLKTIVDTRDWVAQSFMNVLSNLLKSGNKISETALRDHWLIKIRENLNIYPDGWYLPPPHGVGILFGTETNYQRMNYQSLRPKNSWPKESIFLDINKGVIYVFSSPVDKSTGMIGDWGMTIYFGKNPDIIEHLKLCLRLNYQVLEHAQIGMTFSELSNFSNKLFLKEGLYNQVTSITDTTGINIGHTIPWSYEDLLPEEIAIFKTNNWQQIIAMINSKRKFLNFQEKLQIQPGMAFTVEQRLTKLSNKNIPMSSFHTIAIVNPNGTKKLLTNFDEIFKVVGMDYMLKL